MYPRNGTPREPIAIGAVIAIADGAVQTSGVTVRIIPIGVSEADGVGSTAYSTDGIVIYTPTQAETNYTSFIVIAKKSGCIPVAVTVVTSASATPGVAYSDVRLINASTTAAANLALSAAAIATCTVSGTPSTTNIPTSACVPNGAAADQFKGRVIIFRADTTTTALRGQATLISASSNAAAPIFTVIALTTAPASGDTFVIV